VDCREDGEIHFFQMGGGQQGRGREIPMGPTKVCGYDDESDTNEQTTDNQDKVLSLAFFVILMMILAMAPWEYLKRRCICRRIILATWATPLLQETTTSVITSTQEEPIIVRPEAPARNVYRNQTAMDNSHPNAPIWL